MNRKKDSFGSDFLGVLLKAHHDENETQRISVDDLVDECKTFYLAGYKTTYVYLAWTILLLAIHTDWQEAARKEMIDLFGHENPNLDGISILKTVSHKVKNKNIKQFFLTCEILS